MIDKFLHRFLTRRSIFRQYLYVAALMGIALLVRLQIAPVEGGIQYVTFFPAVALSAIIGGIWPGLLAAIIGISFATYFFWPPYYSFALTFHREILVSNVVFFVDAILVCSAIEAMHRFYEQFVAGDKRFRLFMDNSPTIAWVKDEDGRYVYLSHAFEKQFGARFAEWNGKTDAEVWPADIAAEYRKNDLAVLSANEPIQVTEEASEPDRRRSVWLINKFPFQEASGRRYIAGIGLDITEHKAAEKVTRESTKQLRAHIENSPMAVVAWDSEFKVTQWSSQAEQMFGWTAAETIGKPVMELHMIYEPDIPLVERAIAELTDGTSRHAVSSNRNVTKDGRVVHCVWYNSNLLKDDGSMGSVLSQVLDVTEQKRFEEDLEAAKLAAERANDAKSRFLAAVSHDLRQPLSALSLYISALDEKRPSADSSLQGNMRDCVGHLTEMLSNLLDLSRLEAGVITPSIKDFDLEAMMRKIVAAHGPEARARGLALRVGNVSRIGRTDPALFQRMISNLLANAIRYTKQGGVLVGTRRRDGRLWIEVWDTGIGIPAERAADIFEEFTQLGNSERNVAKGTGLGLAIVAGTAELLGLEVRMHSRLGKGSMFAIELAVGEAIPAALQSTYPHRRLRIALVEDNAQVAAALAFALAEVGHQVVSAVSGSQVIERLADTPPDIVISDYRLAGDENGIEVIGRLRSLYGDELPAMILTGDTAPDVIGRLARKKVRIHHKPVDLDVLRMSMAELTLGAKLSS